MSNVGLIRFCHPGTLICSKEIHTFYMRSIPHPKAMPKLERTTPLSYKPSPIEHIQLGAYGVGVGHKEITGDGAMAYQHAIMFLFMNKKAEHARKAVEILDAWATKNKKFEGSNAPLEASWAVTSMVRAAEILKYMWSDEWKKTGVEGRLNAWLDKIILPLVSTRITWTNNWNLTMAEARMQFAIFRENKAEFDWAVREFKRILDVYVKPWKTGQCGETKRDMVHAQFGIGSMINLCEMAWHQGVTDLYTPELMQCMEYHASILNGNVPSDLKKEEIKENRFQPIGWEIGFQHFTKRKGVAMPQTQKMLEANRPEWCIFCWGLSTVTHMK